MAKQVDLTGRRFGKLLAVRIVGRKSRKTLWLCKCDCGTEKPVAQTMLRNGEAKSCGCSRTPRTPFTTRINDGVVVNAETGCWEWQGNTDAGGYGRVSVGNGGRFTKTTLSTHRMAWIGFKGEIPDGLHVLHQCDNRICCNPDHLFLGTHQDNMRDMLNKGRHASQRAAIKRKGGE